MKKIINHSVFIFLVSLSACVNPHEKKDKKYLENILKELEQGKRDSIANASFLPQSTIDPYFPEPRLFTPRLMSSKTNCYQERREMNAVFRRKFNETADSILSIKFAVIDLRNNLEIWKRIKWDAFERIKFNIQLENNANSVLEKLVISSAKKCYCMEMLINDFEQINIK
ncbi:MAG: hypothetical protein US50_C0022G0002 [Candidatus Nomurabacteria bacterium GW2011_GWB1_37_5]|uniref:Lipoprotein n=1 Tax=Candidatus Nomurabacteria bacterium GW2011_GWB1_37_5 TaxID=1618742 RepID=A0A0G0JEJ8_9BACT|nr:MAG: hypothetical protein US50_C0022G0002 [Candidatus Nomurabacteria bacterium GW2011_GWB1_37_5]